MRADRPSTAAAIWDTSSSAREAGAPATLGALAYDAYKRAQTQGLGGDGYPSVAKILEAMAGVELRSAPRHE